MLHTYNAHFHTQWMLLLMYRCLWRGEVRIPVVNTMVCHPNPHFLEINHLFPHLPAGNVAFWQLTSPFLNTAFSQSNHSPWSQPAANDHIRPEQSLGDFSMRKFQGISFSNVTNNGLVRWAPTSLRSSVAAFICWPGFLVSVAIIKLGSLLSLVMMGIPT